MSNGMKTVEVPRNKDDAVAFYREQLEKLTGKMVTFRDRDKFNKAMREGIRRRRKAMKQHVAELEQLVEKHGLKKKAAA